MFYKVLGVFDLNIILKNIVIFIANLLVIAQITKNMSSVYVFLVTYIDGQHIMYGPESKQSQRISIIQNINSILQFPTLI